MAPGPRPRVETRRAAKPNLGRGGYNRDIHHPNTTGIATSAAAHRSLELASGSTQSESAPLLGVNANQNTDRSFQLAGRADLCIDDDPCSILALRFVSMTIEGSR